MEKKANTLPVTALSGFLGMLAGPILSNQYGRELSS